MIKEQKKDDAIKATKGLKYKLLSIHSDNDKINIGDYIQALASSQFLPSIDGFVDRECLSEYDGDECKMVMNGWYMHDPSKWPPSSNISPLFVSFHVNSSASEIMLSNEGLSYLKRYEPIGCRDFYTRDLLLQHGIDAYFSGCMTLTLGEKYKSSTNDGICYFVDPVITVPKSAHVLIKNIFYLIPNIRKVRSVAHKIFDECSLKKKIIIAGFIRTYKKVFTEDTIVNATYIMHESSYYKLNFRDDFERLNEARNLVEKYSKAALVVTSRIHCALPCLGIETPVVFTSKENDRFISSCRFGGLTELFNTVSCDEDNVIRNFEANGLISVNNVVNNKTTWRALADSLIARCMSFIRE